MLPMKTMEKRRDSIGEKERSIIRALQDDIPISETPFELIAKDLGLDEEDLLDTIREMKRSGLLRRFGATLRHKRVGYRANAMSAWRVPADQVENVGRLLASLPQVTHCYERTSQPDWPYNIYAMIHCKSEADCRKIAREISLKTGMEEYVLLFSSQENKKESMRYF
jgi:DNA-binding Lrp family transcriptional regulator